MTDIALAIAGLAEREQILILRSALHVVPDENTLPVQAQFANKVTELDAARLIHAVERGCTVVERERVWTDLAGTLRARMPHLTRIVNECLRLRLVVRTTRMIAPDVWRIRVIAAPVHLRAGENRPACIDRPTAVIRYRVTDDSGLIDCKACLVLDQ